MSDNSYYGEQEGEDAEKTRKESDKSSKDEEIKSKSESSLSLAESVYGQGPLDGLNDNQLVDFMMDMDLEYKHLRSENIMYKQFLKKNDPESLNGFDALMSYLKKPAEDRDRPPPIVQASIDMHVPSVARHSRARFDSITSLSTIAEGKGPRINLSCKSDMVLKAMEETQEGLENFLNKSHRIKQNLKAELEEYSIRESDFAEAREIFERNIVLLGVDPLTQRIPAEKFVRYMEEWLKSAQLNVEKLRLRTATLKIEYRKVSTILERRKELGENVYAVDFDQLKIENKHYRDKIDQKSLHLLELKKMNGGHNLALSNHKKYLWKLQKNFNVLHTQITANEKMIEDTETQCYLMEDDLDKARDKFEYFKRLKSTYRVPDVIDYVKLKSNLYDLKKTIKIWERRKNIQDITLDACLRQMKHITGSPTVMPAWLEDPTPDGSLGNLSTALDQI